MKNRCASFCLVILLCLLPSGCVPMGENYFLYREKGFCAEVRGEMRGTAFSAVIALAAKEGGYRVGVRYLSPGTLSGMEALAACDANGAPQGEGSLLWDGRESKVDETIIAGLLLPICAFLEQDEIASVAYEEKACCLRFADGSVMRLDEDGAPQSLRGERVCLEVVWLEWSEDSNLLKK